MHMQTYDTRTRTSFTTLHVPTFVRKRRSCAKKVRIAPTEPHSPSSCAQRPTEHPERTRDPREEQRAPKRRAARCQAEPPHTIPHTQAQTARSHSARGAAAAAANRQGRRWEVMVVMVVVMMVAAIAVASPPIAAGAAAAAIALSALARPRPSPSALAIVACARARVRESRSSIVG